MLTGILQAGTKALGGARFSLVNLMPTAFFIAFMIALITSGAYTSPKPSPALVLDKFSKNPGLAVAATVGIFLLALLLRPFQVAIVQLLEGYWRRWPLQFANEVATERHRRLQHTAAIVTDIPYPDQPTSSEFGDVASYARQLRASHRTHSRAEMISVRYPLPINSSGGLVDRLMPTILGNALRDGEDNAGRRYGLEMPIVYPRMYPLLSPKLDRAISAQLDMLDTTAAFCVSFGLIALLSLPLIARVDWWSLVPLVAVLMSALAYRGAVATARGHGTLLATAFDLHRFDMLQALHYELPLTPDGELALNKKLSGFLESRDVDAVLRMGKFRYSHPSAPADDGDTSPIPTGTGGDQPSDQSLLCSTSTAPDHPRTLSTTRFLPNSSSCSSRGARLERDSVPPNVIRRASSIRPA